MSAAMTDRPRLAGPPSFHSHLSEGTEDPVTLMSSNGGFWEVDRDGCVIQHLQLILNPERQDRRGSRQAIRTSVTEQGLSFQQ